MGSPALTPLRLNGRTVDFQRGVVTDAAGHTVVLRPQAAEVLKLLAARPGKLVSKDELMQAVWGGIAVTDDSLVQCIAEIRKALGDEKREIVKTILKRGYVFETKQAQVPLWQRWAGLSAIGAAGLAVMAGGVYLLPTTRSGAEPPALAVLPFENIKGDAEWARFADGLTEDIIMDLSRFRDIRVIARTSTETYRDERRDVREIGKTLNVDYVLEGSVQIDGYRMRVTAQLIDASTGAHVWSERYDRDAAEYFPMQDEITEKIGVTLTGWQGQVTEAERTLARRKNGADLDAYDYWLLGIEAKHKMTMAGMIEGRAYLEKGLKLAPDFMPLVRDIGITYSLEMDIGAVFDYPAWVDAQRKYAERALALDPNDSMAQQHDGRGLLLPGRRGTGGTPSETCAAAQPQQRRYDDVFGLELRRLGDGTRVGSRGTDAEAQSALSFLVELSDHADLFRGATVRQGLCGCETSRRVAQPGRLCRHERRSARQDRGSG